MTALIMMIAAAYALGSIFNRKLYETLPVAVFFVTLAVYAFALILPLPVAVYICMAVIAVLFAIGSWQASDHLRKNPFPSISRGHLYYLIPVAVCALLCILLSNRHVFYYDDLSYWALYTKNIFAIDRLPHLFENCSVDYKDYTPVIQILQYIAMFGRKTFSEPYMFATNVCLIYILLLPVLFTDDRPPHIAAIISYVIFPHILTAQFYYRLGVDLFLALVFGYVLYHIFIEDRHDTFTMLALVFAMSFLALIKTSGIVLCLIALVMFALRRADSSRGRIETVILAVFSVGTYMSWQLFLHYSWNNGYLSNRVKTGISGGGFSLPEYTGEVIVNYIKHFFIYPLTRNTVGVSAAVLVIFIIAVYVTMHRTISSGNETLNDGRSKSTAMKIMFISVMIGLVIFMIAHLSMYLFVFDEWEAHGLMEFDRYITQYLGGAFLVYVCLLVRIKSENTGNAAPRILLYLSLIVFVALLPYQDMRQYLVPANYEAMYDDEYALMERNARDEWESSGIDDLHLSHDGTQKLTVVADAWDETTQFIEYTAVPQPINRIANVPAVEPGRICGFIMDTVDEYVYVCENAPASYTGDWSETKAITSDGTSLRPGSLYQVAGSGDEKILRACSF